MPAAVLFGLIGAIVGGAVGGESGALLGVAIGVGAALVKTLNSHYEPLESEIADLRILLRNHE